MCTVNIKPDDVIAMIDDTAFGGAKDSIIFTEELILVKEFLVEEKVFSINKVKSMHTEGCNLFINEDKITKVHFQTEDNFEAVILSIMVYINHHYNSKMPNFDTTLKTNIDKLNKHAIYDADETVRYSYASILFSMITLIGAISDARTEILLKLLKSLGFEDIRARLFEDTRVINEEKVIKAINDIKRIDAQSNFIFDALILLGCDKIKNDERSALQNICKILNVSEEELANSEKFSKAIVDEAIELNEDSYYDYIREYWPSKTPIHIKSNKETENKFENKIILIDSDITTSYPWSVNSCIIIFRNNAAIMTELTHEHTYESINFNESMLIKPKLYFIDVEDSCTDSFKANINFNKCDLIGNYDSKNLGDHLKKHEETDDLLISSATICIISNNSKIKSSINECFIEISNTAGIILIDGTDNSGSQLNINNSRLNAINTLYLISGNTKINSINSDYFINSSYSGILSTDTEGKFINCRFDGFNLENHFEPTLALDGSFEQCKFKSCSITHKKTKLTSCVLEKCRLIIYKSDNEKPKTITNDTNTDDLEVLHVDYNEYLMFERFVEHISS